jgi:transcription initiation factor TFIIIB Brf1 subunit/transcription initiation factor TFIIB
MILSIQARKQEKRVPKHFDEVAETLRVEREDIEIIRI